MLGGSLLAAALALGGWAHRTSGQEALAAWMREHPPSASAWSHALGATGYRAVALAAAWQRAYRSLPLELDSADAAWMTSDRAWLAVFRAPERDPARPVAFFCLACEGTPKDWEPVGRSWKGFERALALAEEARRRAGAERPRPARSRADPREIRY
jgi:hypothetical protein